MRYRDRKRGLRARVPCRPPRRHAATRRIAQGRPDAAAGGRPHRQDAADRQHGGEPRPDRQRRETPHRLSAGIIFAPFLAPWTHVAWARKCAPDVAHFFTFSGSLTSSNLANSVFHNSPFSFSTLRM